MPDPSQSLEFRVLSACRRVLGNDPSMEIGKLVKAVAELIELSTSSREVGVAVRELDKSGQLDSARQPIEFLK